MNSSNHMKLYRSVAFVSGISLFVFVCVRCADMGKKRIDKIRNVPPLKKYYVLKKEHRVVHEALSEGMTKDDVRRIIGEPQNSNSKYVWMWCERYDKTQGHKRGDTWQAMKFGRGGYYLVFYDDILLTRYLIKNAEGDPWEILSNKADLTVDEAKELLLEK